MDHVSTVGILSQNLEALPTRAGRDPAERFSGFSDEFGWTTWWTVISLQAFVQRLALLVELELPCAMGLGNTLVDQGCYGPLRDCRRQNGQLSLSGDHFCLHLHEDSIALLRLVDRQRNSERETGVEIYGSDGTLIARILSTPDRERSAVWRDIMDTFTLGTA
jgi:putative heme degradation protein